MNHRAGCVEVSLHPVSLATCAAADVYLNEHWVRPSSACIDIVLPGWLGEVLVHSLSGDQHLIDAAQNPHWPLHLSAAVGISTTTHPLLAKALGVPDDAC